MTRGPMQAAVTSAAAGGFAVADADAAGAGADAAVALFRRFSGDCPRCCCCCRSTCCSPGELDEAREVGKCEFPELKTSGEEDDWTPERTMRSCAACSVGAAEALQRRPDSSVGGGGFALPIGRAWLFARLEFEAAKEPSNPSLPAAAARDAAEFAAAAEACCTASAPASPPPGCESLPAKMRPLGNMRADDVAGCEVLAVSDASEPG